MKKRLTRLLLLALALSMVFSLAACGGGGASSTASQAPAQTDNNSSEAAESGGGDTAEPAGDFKEPLINYEITAGSGTTIIHDDPAKFTDGSFERVLEAGVFEVGTEGNWTPFIYNDPDQDNKLVGSEVEVCDGIAEIYGFVNNWHVASQWDGVMAGLDAKRYDTVYCGMSPGNENYWEKYQFTRPYNQQKTVLVTAADSDIEKWEDLEGRTCANSLTSGYGIIVTEYGADHVPSQSLAQAMELLVTGRADGHIQGDIAVAAFQKEKPDYADKIKIVCEYEYEDPMRVWYAGCYRQGDDSMTAAASMAIDEMLQNGTMHDILSRYVSPEFADENPWIVK